MKKIILILTVLICLGIGVNAQTSAQKDLIYSFFRRDATQEAISMMHPSCDFRRVVITDISNNSVYFSATFVDHSFWGSGDQFTCKYRLDINNDGEFTYLAMVRCGNVKDSGGVMECGGAATAAKFIKQEIWEEQLESDHPAVRMQESRKGKKLSQFRGREIICAALFTIWYNDGYYRQY